MKILLKVKYDGAGFCGYQVQPGKRTVQGALNDASLLVFGKKCNITGCSRTDSGVHALSFYATVKPCDESDILVPAKNIPRALNAALPNDISVLGAYEVDDDFHPRYDVIKKEYTYLILNTDIKDPFLNCRALHYQKYIDDDHIRLMNDAANFLCGKHDYRCFMAEGSSVVDTVREIYYARFERTGDLLTFKICGNGFLYNMVRIIVGTLLDVANDKINPDHIKHIIDSKDRTMAGQTVSACGLYLSRVDYPKTFD